MTPAMFDVVEGLQPLADDKSCTMAQLALAWCLRQPGVTAPIIGPRTMSQLEDNLGALQVTVNDQDCETIDRLNGPGQAASPFYQADFGPHQFPVE